MRNLTLWITAAIILLSVNYTIWQREDLIANGRMVLLELAPVDPRSLMQGDYMALRFKMIGDAFSKGVAKGMRDGEMVVALDSRQVGTFRRFSKTTRGADETLLRYRIRNGQPKLATNAFFFQEKQERYYHGARFGEFRVSSRGDALLVALRDAELRRLGPEAGTAGRDEAIQGAR